ncbi:MAG: CDP-alcohol phosphatidyltransferase family protein, partial [Desulfurococcales archaeon]|nr:CDP-alcohol phosphatidyltransferase family protein [Desulfurococcales archaeon]
MVLSRLRPQSQRLLSVLARKAGRVNPDYITLATPLIALTVPLSVYYNHYWIALLMIMVTGFFDILDGAIARYSGRSSPRGAFLDSMMDRFVDILYYATLIL